MSGRDFLRDRLNWPRHLFSLPVQQDRNVGIVLVHSDPQRKPTFSSEFRYRRQRCSVDVVFTRVFVIVIGRDSRRLYQHFSNNIRLSDLRQVDRQTRRYFQFPIQYLIFVRVICDRYVSGKIICISWDSTGEWLVTGSVNAVRVYSRRSGHAVHKLPTGQSETIVSSIAVTKDFTIISADSW